MKYLFNLVLSFYSFIAFSQNISSINRDIKLPDSLTYNSEIRIYQDQSTTNYSSIFRMFKDGDHWTIEFYEHYNKIDSITDLKVIKKELKAKNDLEFVYQNLLRSYILNLPSLSEIWWKLQKRGTVEKAKRKFRGKEIEEYDFNSTGIAVLDGEGYNIQVKSFGKYNEFFYSNPDTYLKHYPEIDELIYFNEILNLIRNEFDIWKD